MNATDDRGGGAGSDRSGGGATDSRGGGTVDDSLAWAVLAAGVVFAANPLYRDALAGTGVTQAVDWLAAVGVVPAGSYHLVVGVTYLLGGSLVLTAGGRRGWTFRRLALAAGAGLLVAWAGLLAVRSVGGPALGVGAVAFALATGPVLVGLLVGAAPDRSTARTLLVVAGLLVVPFAGRQLGRALSSGGLATLGGAVAVGSVGLVVVMDLLWGYPLYRLGRSLRAGSR